MSDRTLEKCDGNHTGPKCADPECWNDCPTSNPSASILRRLDEVVEGRAVLPPTQKHFLLKDAREHIAGLQKTIDLLREMRSTDKENS